jgi:hypothetical protein
MVEVFIIERMIAPGIWELLSDTAYLNKSTALTECEFAIKTMQKTDKNFAARVSKLKIKN